MKKSLLAALIAGILLVTAGAFAGTISISPIPDVIVVNDGDPTGAAGDDAFVFSKAYTFQANVTGGTSTEPITLSYAEVGADGTVASDQLVTIESVVQDGTISGGISAEVVLGDITTVNTDGALNVEFANATAAGTSAFTKTVRLFGKSGDTNPGSDDFDISLEKYTDASTIDRFSTAGEVVVDDSFDTTSDGWTYVDQMAGTTTEASASGALEITYDAAAGSYGFWQRPGSLWTASSPKQGELYVMKANVSATPVSGQTGEGSVPDFRLNASSTASTTLSTLQVINTYCTDATDANYIAPTVAGRDYNYIFEPNSLNGNTEQLMLQFEGYNFPGSLALGGTRPDREGGKVALDSVVVTKLDFDTTDAGTAVATISSAADFAQGSGSAYGWRWEAGAGASNVGLTQGTGTGSLSVTFDATSFPAGSYAYGSWDAYAIDAASPMTFEGQKLYRATFTLTGAGVDYGAYQNNIQPNFRMQTGDFHQTCTSSGYQANGTGIRFTSDPATTPKMNLWFYYDGATRSIVDRGGWSYKENTLWPSFEGIIANNGLLVPVNAALTLSEIEVTSHDITLP